MAYANLQEEYDALETRVLRALGVLIDNSDHISDFRDCKAIKIDYDNYVEIAFDNRLILLDAEGYDYDISVVTLEKLIDILTNI